MSNEPKTAAAHNAQHTGKAELADGGVMPIAAALKNAKEAVREDRRGLAVFLRSHSLLRMVGLLKTDKEKLEYLASIIELCD